MRYCFVRGQRAVGDGSDDDGPKVLWLHDPHPVAQFFPCLPPKQTYQQLWATQ
jgi:hypothetical protein